MKEYYCTVCGRKHNGKYSSRYCRKHKWQTDKYGRVLDSNPRTKYDPNEFRFIGDYVEFDTYSYPSQEVCKTYIIDAEDYPRVSKKKWFTTSSGYAYCKDSKILLHRFLLDALPGQEVDHIDTNVLNNRKSNLRFCTGSLNKVNRRARNNTNIKGLRMHSNGKYSACLIYKGKQYHSPCYSTIAEVAFARFILEQMFVKDFVFQANSDLYRDLSESQKESIIDGIKRKFDVS